MNTPKRIFTLTENEYFAFGFADPRFHATIKNQIIYTWNAHETIISPTENE